MDISMKPRDGWTLVEPIQEDLDESSIFVLPDSTKEQSQYMMGHSGDQIIVFPRHLMVEIEYKNQIFNLIEEKYIVADIQEIKTNYCQEDDGNV